MLISKNRISSVQLASLLAIGTLVFLTTQVFEKRKRFIRNKTKKGLCHYNGTGLFRVCSLGYLALQIVYECLNILRRFL